MDASTLIRKIDTLLINAGTSLNVEYKHKRKKFAATVYVSTNGNYKVYTSLADRLEDALNQVYKHILDGNTVPDCNCGKNTF